MVNFSSFASLNHNHLNRILNYRQYLEELIFEGFGFSDVFTCCDMQKLEKLKKLIYKHI